MNSKPSEIESLADKKVPADNPLYVHIQNYIRENIPPVKAKYTYDGEDCINPGYENIEHHPCSLGPAEKRIWVLRGDFILATGVKNAYQELGYSGLKDSFIEILHRFLNWKDRYGHPSLAIADNNYDGSVLYAGYICQRPGFLQVYLVSGRYERSDLNVEQTRILEAYIAARFQQAYGEQEIVFDYGNSEIPEYHIRFFGDGVFEKDNPQRRYDSRLIADILHTAAGTEKSDVAAGMEDGPNVSW